MKTDYGWDPLGDGKWKLVPSGEIVDLDGLNAWKATQPVRPKPVDDCFGKSWDEIERMQGGKLRRNK